MTQMAKRPSYLRLFLTREREREGGTYAMETPYGSIRDECKVLTRKQEERRREREKRMRKEKGGGRERRTTRFTTMQLDRAFTSFPFLNACVSTYRNGVYSPIQTRIVFRTVKWKQKATWREGKVRRPGSVVAEGAGCTSACVRVNSRTR